MVSSFLFLFVTAVRLLSFVLQYYLRGSMHQEAPSTTYFTKGMTEGLNGALVPLLLATFSSLRRKIN
jgi:hypothetical protein